MPSVDEPGIYNCLHVLRAERGLSRQDLAAALDIHYQTVGYLERGEYSPSLGLALRIGDYFGLPIEAIFSPRPFKPMSVELGEQRAAGGGRQSSGARVGRQGRSG